METSREMLLGIGLDVVVCLLWQRVLDFMVRCRLWLVISGIGCVSGCLLDGGYKL